MIFRTLLLQFLVVLFAISMSDAVSAAEGMARADETVDHDERKTAHWRGAINPAQETNARMTVWAKSGRTFKTENYSKPGNGAGLSWDTITDTSSKAAFEAIVLASANHPKSYSPTFGGEFEVEGSGGGPGTTPTWNVDGTLMVDGHRHYREWREDFNNPDFSMTIDGKDATDPTSWALPATFSPYLTIETEDAMVTGVIFIRLIGTMALHPAIGPDGNPIPDTTTSGSYTISPFLGSQSFQAIAETKTKNCATCNDNCLYQSSMHLNIVRNMTSELKLPEWDGYVNVSQAAKNEWDKVIGLIKEHEKQHVEDAAKFFCADFFTHWCKQKHCVEACYGATQDAKDGALLDIIDKILLYGQEYVTAFETLLDTYYQNKRNTDMEDTTFSTLETWIQDGTLDMTIPL